MKDLLLLHLAIRSSDHANLWGINPHSFVYHLTTRDIAIYGGSAAGLVRSHYELERNMRRLERKLCHVTRT